MHTAFAERHIRSLLLAKTCAELSARVRTIVYVTGLNHAEVVRLFFVDEQSAPRGRPPESADWFDNKSNLLDKVEASILVALFARIRALEFGPADALVGAFKHYREKCSSGPRISFDRGFDLVCNTYGIWLADKPQLTLITCRVRIRRS